jgi:hypothetical protein
MFICLRRLERNLFYRYFNMASEISQNYVSRKFVEMLDKQLKFNNIASIGANQFLSKKYEWI